MKIQAKFINEKIIVERAKDVGRLFNKSHIGTPLKNNKLDLDLIEGCFLIDEDKINITKDEKKLSFDELISIAAAKSRDFDVKYIVFKDLKNRGRSVKLYKDSKNVTFYDFKEEFFVCVFSENSLFNVKETIALAGEIVKKDSKLWFAVVDCEGDVTYYDVSIVDFKGFNKKGNYSKNKSFLFDNSVIVFDEKLKNNLFKKEFFGKPFGNGLRLSFVESLYLSDEEILNIEDINEKDISRKDFVKKIRDIDSIFDDRFNVYSDLKKRGLIVKTGFKFGTDFRCYTRNPEEIHAEYLVHIVDEKFKSVWSEMSRAIRLAHSVNKEIIFACVEKDKIEYIKFGRLKP